MFSSLVSCFFFNGKQFHDAFVLGILWDGVSILYTHVSNADVHYYATYAGTGVPFEIHTQVLFLGPIFCNIVVLLEGGGNAFGVFLTHVFNSKVVNHKTKQDGLPFVALDAWRCWSLVVSLFFKMIAELRVGQDAGARKITRRL